MNKEQKKDGVCRFCGQAVLDGEECNCAEALAERERVQQIKRASIEVEALFEDAANPQIIEIMKAALIPIVYWDLNKISLTIPGGVKASISYNAGKIKIVRTDTNKESQEV